MLNAKRQRKVRPAAYVLLETVVATGLLLVGMAVIGAQFQEANVTVRKMNLRMRAMMLAETQLGERDLGLIHLDSADKIQEEDFGPRYPNWAWRMTVEETSLDKMFLLRTDVLYWARDDYDEEFDYDAAETMYTLYALRATPQSLDLPTDFGLSEEQTKDLTEKLAGLGEGFDPGDFDPSILGRLPSDELIEVLPTFLQAIGVPLSEIERMLPPDVRSQLDKLGILDQLEEGKKDSSDGGDEADEKGDDIPNENEEESDE
jgi:type II secretory pathway pseudopilin PulG